MNDTVSVNRHARRIVDINFLPLAQQMRAWLQQRGQLPVVSRADREAKGGYTNPYTFSGVALALIMGRVINSFHDYVNEQTPDHDEVDAEDRATAFVQRSCSVLSKALRGFDQAAALLHADAGVAVRARGARCSARVSVPKLQEAEREKASLRLVGWIPGASLSLVPGIRALRDGSHGPIELAQELTGGTR